MPTKMISLEYPCKKCGAPVKFTADPFEAGAWKLNAPAMQCFPSLAPETRERVAALKCEKCAKTAQDFFGRPQPGA